MKTLLALLYELTVGCVISTFHTFYGRHEEPKYYEVTAWINPLRSGNLVRMGAATVYRKVIPAEEWNVVDYL